MIKSVNPYPVSSYFNPDEAQTFFIPKYQREYVWRKDNWEALFNDLEEAEPGHFLGSIICVNTQADGMAGSRLELIDGQQRFMTISLLFCALFARLNDVPDKDDELHVELINLRNRLFVKSSRAWRFEPTEQSHNKADLQKVLSERFPKYAQPPRGLKNFGNRRIARAYGYFCDRLADLSDAEALVLLEKLKAAVLVKIEVPSHSDAFTLFETINNRGIPLSPIDIIKNNLLAALEKDPDYGIDRAFDDWQLLTERIPDPVVQERFLRQLYNAFKYLRHVEVRGCPRAMKSNLIRIYDALIAKNPALLFVELQKQGAVYAKLLDPLAAANEWSDETANALRDLQRLGAAPAYTFLLWAIHVTQVRRWSAVDVLFPLAAFMGRWLFWRNLTDVPPTRDLDQMFIDLIRDVLARLRSGEIHTPDGFVAAAQVGLQGHAASDDLCEQRLRGDVYLNNYDATRFLLCKIEEAHQTRETAVDLWKVAANGHPVFTVEHILPKTENLGEAWVNVLGAGSAQEAEDIRQRCAHKLGNLTLSGYNWNLGKMEFARKRDRTDDEGRPIGYRNGLYLNRELADRQAWNEAAISARTDVLVNEVKSILGLWAGT
ncbi:MAG: DUF262 domain-containing protein [Rhodospirillales bacterium]|nr:MAG: DUF262 domain-containing protein [Rhodospirillales bacterium]